MRLRPTSHAIQRFAQRYRLDYRQAADILATLEWQEMGWRFYRAYWNGKPIDGPGDGRLLFTVFPSIEARSYAQTQSAFPLLWR